MEHLTSGTALEARLTTLESRIAALKQHMKTATAPVMVEDLGALTKLEARHKILAEQFRQLDLADLSFYQRMKAEIAVMADGLTSAVDDIIAQADANCQPDQRPDPSKST